MMYRRYPGSRTMRYVCETDEQPPLRDVTLSVNVDFEPLADFIRLSKSQEFVGSAGSVLQIEPGSPAMSTGPSSCLGIW